MISRVSLAYHSKFGGGDGRVWFLVSSPPSPDPTVLFFFPFRLASLVTDTQYSVPYGYLSIPFTAQL